MNIIRTFTPAALVVALSLTAMPAAAQGRDRNDRGREQRQSGRQDSRDNRQRQGDRGDASPRPAPRDSAPRAVAPRDNGPRGNTPRAVAPRDNGQRAVAPRDQSRDFGRSTAVPRTYVAPRYEPQRDRNWDRGNWDRDRGRFDARPGFRSDFRVRSRSIYIGSYRPHFFERPFFSFRPRLSIGFGLWLGYPVPYPSSWYSIYAPPVYGYYGGAVRVVPGASDYGGVSFDVTPSDAGIWLDGEYIGTVSDFSPYAVPLTVTPGLHRIEVAADGYEPMAWDVTVVPGQVIPIGGRMEPY